MIARRARKCKCETPRALIRGHTTTQELVAWGLHILAEYIRTGPRHAYKALTTKCADHCSRTWEPPECAISPWPIPTAPRHHHHLEERATCPHIQQNHLYPSRRSIWRDRNCRGGNASYHQPVDRVDPARSFSSHRLYQICSNTRFRWSAGLHGHWWPLPKRKWNKVCRSRLCKSERLWGLSRAPQDLISKRTSQLCQKYWFPGPIYDGWMRSCQRSRWHSDI